MAFSIPNGAFQLQQTEPDILAAVSNGITAGLKPRAQAEQLVQSMLANKIQGAQAKYAQQLEAAKLAHQNALIERAKRGPAPPAEVATLEWLLKNKDRFNQGQEKNSSPEQESIPGVGENQNSYIQSLSENRPSKTEPNNQPDWAQKIYQHALNKASGIAEPKKYAPSNTLKELTEQADAEAGFIPGTDRKQPFPDERSQQEFLNALSAKTGGLPKGQHFAIGENGERIGVVRPKTAKERDVDRGTVTFKEFYPLVNFGLNRYSGENSIRNMEEDARNYKTNPEARKRIDQLLLARKVATLTTVNEAARFGAGKQNQVFNQFRKSLESYDVPERLDKLITQFQIPASANIKAGIRFQQILDKADKKYHNTAEPNTTEYYPGKAPKSKEDPSNPKTWEAGEGLIQDPNTQEWATVPVREGEWEEFLKDGGKRNV